ncbi:hypothetical protein DM02DRAFT_222868 [Periconia macrospinosa]|uniref:Uncharacterized protein n=1 Tax=Periconia macrospinosa TaxID=97972 RepID=A0A2V1D604_9PLEO|nr:hypothetical protein DM02DRAFT_222868 [Periconia macrospinosa]
MGCSVVCIAAPLRALKICCCRYASTLLGIEYSLSRYYGIIWKLWHEQHKQPLHSTYIVISPFLLVTLSPAPFLLPFMPRSLKHGQNPRIHTKTSLAPAVRQRPRCHADGACLETASFRSPLHEPHIIIKPPIAM